MEDVVKGILSQEEINQLFKTANTTYTIVEPKKETTVKKAEGVSIRKALLQAKLYKGIKNLRVRIKGRLKDMVEKYNAKLKKEKKERMYKDIISAATKLGENENLDANNKAAEQMKYINARLKEAGLIGMSFVDIPLKELSIKVVPGSNIERIRIPKSSILDKHFMKSSLKLINKFDEEIEEVDKERASIKNDEGDTKKYFSKIVTNLMKLDELGEKKLSLLRDTFTIKENEPLDDQPIFKDESQNDSGKKEREDANSVIRDGNYIKYTDNMGRQYSDYLPEEPVIDEPKPIVANKFDLEGELNNMFNKSPEVSSDKEETSFKDEFINNQKLENTEEISETPITLDIPEIKDEELTSEENQRLAEQVQNKYEKELHDKKQAEYDSPEYKLEMAKEDYRKILEDPNAKPEDIAYLKGYAEGLAHQIAGPNQELLEEILYKVKSVEKNVKVLREESLKNHKDTLLAVTHSTKGESEIKPLEDQRQYIITSE